MSASEPNYWVFSSNPEGYYENNVWDLATILKTNKYSIKQREKNRARVKPRDIVYMRVYGRAYTGTFVIDGEWTAFPQKQQEWEGKVAGFFPMREVSLWSRPLPQDLIMRDLSNHDYRGRIVGITPHDALMIETAQRTYTRLGFGNADGHIVVLERGLEEAIKPNLKQMGLKLADRPIRQQFSMGPGVGRSDLICVDEADDLVIIELKRGMTSDEAIGQVLRYVGWVRENVAADGQKVHGWIIAGDYDEHLRLAAAAAGVRLVLVRLG